VSKLPSCAKRCFVLGDRGFIGKYVVERLNEIGFHVLLSSTIGLRLENHKDFENAYSDFNPHSIINLAGFSTLDEDRIGSVYYQNALILLPILEFLKKKKFNGVWVQASSAQVYGQQMRMPIKETAVVYPKNHYAASKVLAESLLRSYSEGVFDVNIVRIFNTFGKGQPIRYLVPSLVKQFAANLDVIRVGNTNVWRDFVDVRDLADLFVNLVDRKNGVCIVNGSSGRWVNVSWFVDCLAKNFGRSPEIHVSSELVRSNEITRLIGSVELSGSLGWRPKRRLEETVNWIVSE